MFFDSHHYPARLVEYCVKKNTINTIYFPQSIQPWKPYLCLFKGIIYIIYRTNDSNIYRIASFDPSTKQFNIEKTIDDVNICLPQCIVIGDDIHIFSSASSVHVIYDPKANRIYTKEDGVKETALIRCIINQFICFGGSLYVVGMVPGDTIIKSSIIKKDCNENIEWTRIGRK